MATGVTLISMPTHFQAASDRRKSEASNALGRDVSTLRHVQQKTTCRCCCRAHPSAFSRTPKKIPVSRAAAMIEKTMASG